MSQWPTESELKTQPEEPQSPWHILNAEAEQLETQSEGKFAGQVTETVREEEVTYAFYIVVPQLRDYMYRLFEARMTNYLNPYPVEFRLFAKDPKNNQQARCYTPEELRQKLTEWIQSPITRLILSALTQQIDIMASYRKDLDSN